jgi:hypothetical protein
MPNFDAIALNKTPGNIDSYFRQANQGKHQVREY